MSNYSIILDVWEGNLEMNEDAFKAGGVAGLNVRLNDMNGGHHMDANFAKQWSESLSLSPVPYFVYNPWVNGQANFDWLASHMPVGCPAVFIDIEVRYPGYLPGMYAAEFDLFCRKAMAKWKTIIYTGAGFQDALTYWPIYLDYWWAQYPYPLYKSATTPAIKVTWEELHGYVDKLPWPPVNGNQCKGKIKLHQCSGDRFIVPGASTVMDVSIFPGTPAEYRTWLGYDMVTPPAVLTLDQRVANLEAQAKEHGWILQ